MTCLEEKIVDAVRVAIGRDAAGLHEPSLDSREIENVTACIKSTFVSSVGEFVSRFETDLAKYVGVKRAVAVVNGTAALQIALMLAGVRPGDEVLVPALTFVATANAVSYLGASPHFVDSSTKTLGVDPVQLRLHLEKIGKLDSGLLRNRETGAVIRALVPMHTFGHPCEMRSLLEIAAEFNLTVVEDAAESLGSKYLGQHTGSFGKLAAVSFNGNKIITTGGGGAILTNDEDLADEAKHLTTTAKVPHRWEYVHDRIGYNYRMPNLNAALGCAQLEKLPTLIQAKRQLATRYFQAFRGIDKVEIFSEPQNCASNYWLQTLVLDEAVSSGRDDVLAKCNECGVMARPVWRLLHRLPFFHGCPSASLCGAEACERRLINLPSSSFLI